MSALSRAPKLVDRNGKLSPGLRSAKGRQADWSGTARVQRIVLGILQHSAAVLLFCCSLETCCRRACGLSFRFRVDLRVFLRGLFSYSGGVPEKMPLFGTRFH